MGQLFILLALQYFFCLLIIVMVQMRKFIIVKKVRSTRFASHISVMLAVIFAILDNTSRILENNFDSPIYGLCYIPSAFPLYFTCTAYALSLYHWVAIYKMPNKNMIVCQIVFAVSLLLLFALLSTSVVLYCMAAERNFNEDAGKLFVISNLLYAFGAITGSLFCFCGFLIYGIKIVRKLKAGRTGRITNENDAHVEKMTIHAVILSMTFFIETCIAAVLFSLYEYDIIEGVVTQITQRIFLWLQLVAMLYIAKPKQLKPNHSINVPVRNRSTDLMITEKSINGTQII